MTKGILVILMVVYHSLNYTNQYHLAFRYFSFLPSSFILITGILVSKVYAPRYSAGDRSVVRRLIVRGLRLILLFTALNIIGQFVQSPAYGRSLGIVGFCQNWEQIYLSGGGRAAAFEVLLPIAYLLLLAPLLLALADHHAVLLPLTTVLFVAGCTFLDEVGLGKANLNFIGAGLIGMMIGRWPFDLALLGRYFWLPLAGFVAYYPLGVAKGIHYIVQLTGAFIAIALVCAFSVALGDRGWWRQKLIRIGQYSLVSYITQIGILQILSRFIGRPDPWSIDGMALFLVTLVFMMFLVELTEWIRSHSSIAEKLYSTVFA
jgi:hypothetical protein